MITCLCCVSQWFLIQVVLSIMHPIMGWFRSCDMLNGSDSQLHTNQFQFNGIQLETRIYNHHCAHSNFHPTTRTTHNFGCDNLHYSYSVVHTTGVEVLPYPDQTSDEWDGRDDMWEYAIKSSRLLPAADDDLRWHRRENARPTAAVITTTRDNDTLEHHLWSDRKHCEFIPTCTHVINFASSTSSINQQHEQNCKNMSHPRYMV